MKFIVVEGTARKYTNTSFVGTTEPPTEEYPVTYILNPDEVVYLTDYMGQYHHEGWVRIGLKGGGVFDINCPINKVAAALASAGHEIR